MLLAVVAELLRRNRLDAQPGREIIETHTAFFGRYYTSDTQERGRGKILLSKSQRRATATDPSAPLIPSFQNRSRHSTSRIPHAFSEGRCCGPATGCIGNPG